MRRDTERANVGTFWCRIAAETVDADARTAELVWTTGARVHRRSFDGDFIEELEVTPKAVRLERLNRGAPLLDTHWATELRDQIGVVRRAWVSKGEGGAVVEFSDRDERVNGIFRDVQRGILRNVSVGYRVFKTEERNSNEEGGLTIRRHTDWEPMELSIVPIGADVGAAVRAGDEPQSNDCEVQRAFSPTERSSAMARKAKPEAKGVEPEEIRDDQVEDETEDEEQEAEREAPKTAKRKAAPKQEDNVVDIDKVRKEERERGREIRGIYRKLGLNDEAAEKAIEENLTADQAARRAIDLAADEDAKVQINPHIRTPIGGRDEAETRRELMASALMHRVGTLKPQDLPDGARQYRGMKLPHMARECLEVAGVSTRGLTDFEAVSFATNTTRAAGLHGTSDFPLILQEALNKRLLMAYEEAVSVYRTIARQTTASDFRTKHNLKLGSAPSLEQVDEHGEFKRGTIAEGDETYQVNTFGKIIGLTRQAIVNDDLNAFDEIPTRMGRAASRLEADTVIGLITSNPLLSDAVAVFAAGHNNLTTGPGTAISVAAINVMRSRMRTQTDLDGTTLINIMPTYMLVPAALETLAEQILSPLVVPESPSNVTPPSMRSLSLLVDARLDAVSTTAWYMFASPGEADGLEYAFLEGSTGPFTDTREGFDVDGVEFKIRHDFGAGWVDFRGAQKDDGA